MDETTQQNAALVEEIATSSENLQQQATELLQLVEFFKISEEGRQGYQAGTQKTRTTTHKPLVSTKHPVIPGHKPMTHGQPTKRVTEYKERVNFSHDNGHEHDKEHQATTAGAVKPEASVGNGHQERHDSFEEF